VRIIRWILLWFAVLLAPALADNPLGSGYNIKANGTLFATVNAAMAGMTLPFGYSYNLQTTGTPTTGNYFLVSNASAATQLGFASYFLSGTTNDTYQFQNYIEPVAASAASCAQPSVLCWRYPRINNGQLHNVCASYTATGADLYIDGILRDHNTSINNYSAGTDAVWTIGQTPPTSLTLYDLRVYGRLVSAADCVALANAALIGGTYPTSGSLNTGMVLHLPLDNCTFAAPAWICNSTEGYNNVATTGNVAVAVSITSPAAGPVTGNSVAMQSNCVTGTTNCVKVCYYIDNVLVSSSCPTTPPFAYAWDSTTVLDGSHSMTAVGFSGSGLAATSAARTLNTTGNGTVAQNYYFSTSTGSDTLPGPVNNPCTTQVTPCASLAQLATLALHGGDTVNFFSEDTWTQTTSVVLCGPGTGGACTQNFWPSSATLTLTTYGTAGCNAMTGSVVLSGTPPAGVPVLPAHCARLNMTTPYPAPSGIKLINASNVTIQNLAVTAGNGGNAAGNYYTAFAFDITASTNGIGQSAGVTVQNNYSYQYNAVGINCISQCANSSTIGPVTNYQILNNYFTANPVAIVNASPQTGIRTMSNTQGLVHGNVVEYNGYGASQGNGIFISNYPNPRGTATTVEYNVVRYNGGNWTDGLGGPYGLYTAQADYVTFQFNEEYHQQCWNPGGFPACNSNNNTVDNGGVDFDHGTEHTILQYSYIHDNPMGNSSPAELFVQSVTNFSGGVVQNPVWGYNISRYNIFENNNNPITIQGDANQQNAAVQNTFFYNNTVVALTGQQCWTLGGPSAVIVYNNNCIKTAGNFVYNTYSGYHNLLGQPMVDYNNYWLVAGGTPLVSAPNQGGNLTLAQINTAMGWEAHSQTIPANIAGTAGTVGICYTTSTSPPPGPAASCPNTYQLVTASPLIGAGANIDALFLLPFPTPTQDFYGKTLPYPSAGSPTGSGFPIGASAGP